jgi:hypothetical protein
MPVSASLPVACWSRCVVVVELPQQRLSRPGQMVLLQLLRELRRFAQLKAIRQHSEANNLFFFSFVGSIICEHAPSARRRARS